MLGALTTNDSDISEGNTLSGGRTSCAWSMSDKKGGILMRKPPFFGIRNFFGIFGRLFFCEKRGIRVSFCDFDALYAAFHHQSSQERVIEEGAFQHLCE